MRRQREPIVPNPPPDLSAHFEGTSLPELITRAVLEFPDGVGMADSRGRIKFANASMERMLGYERGELIGVHISRLYPGGTDSPVLRQTMESLQAGGWSGERNLLTKQGSVVPMLETVKPLNDEAGKPVGYVCTLRDIRERRAREQALQESEEQYRQLYENAPIGDFSVDMDGRIHDVNKSAVQLLGYARDDLIGRSIIDLYADTPAGKEKAQQLNQRIRAGEEVYDEEMEMRRADGSSVWVSLTVQLVRDAQGQPIGRRGLVLDTTGRKLAEEALRERERERAQALEQLQVAQQQLIQSGKLAAMGELVAGVAHEINNPLAAILGYTQLLLRGDSGEKDRGRLERVLAETERVARIVQNLLSFARQQKPEWEAFCVNKALASVMELRGYDLKVNNIELTMDLAPGAQVVIGDRQQLEQVFLNIVNNAERAMTTAHQRGRLEVKTRRVKNSVRITFVDDGPGIPADIVQSIFDPFFTTAEPGEGTGLGLSICYGIVQELGGRIEMETPQQGGCAFVVELPLAEDPQISCDPPSDSGTGG